MLDWEKNCTLYIECEKTDLVSVEELRGKLESAKDEDKIAGLELTLKGMIQGEDYSRLLMPVIRYIIPCKNHRVKKLCQLYFEVVDKCKPDGVSLREEMILVCNALQRDLESSNEYVCGSTLRLLCKMKHEKLVEPLIEPIVSNLTHRDAYVRKNAVMCIYAIVTFFGLDIIPHASEEISKLLAVEFDLSTRRNAVLMLIHTDDHLAVDYILSIQNTVTQLGDIFQLVLLELLVKICKREPAKKPILLKLIVSILSTASQTVMYEGANALVSLSRSPLCIRTAFQTYVKILQDHTDVNVKLIVLDRLSFIVRRNGEVLEDTVLDLLRCLSCTCMVVKQKCLVIILNLITKRSVHEVVNILKRELIRASEPDQLKVVNNVEYRRLVVKCIHHICTKFPDASHNVLQLLIDYLSESDRNLTTEVALFLRELISVLHDKEETRHLIIESIIESLKDIQQSRVHRICLWILGEHTDNVSQSSEVIQTLFTLLHPLPLVSDKSETKAPTPPSETGKTAPLQVYTRTVILPDGTYGTEDIICDAAAAEKNADENSGKPSFLREILVSGDMLLASGLCLTLTKLTLRNYLYFINRDVSHEKMSNKFLNLSMFMVTSILNFFQSSPSLAVLSNARLMQSFRCLIQINALNKKYNLHAEKRLPPDVEVVPADFLELQNSRAVFLVGCSAALKPVLDIENMNNSALELIEDGSGLNRNFSNTDTAESYTQTQPDHILEFRQMRGNQTDDGEDGIDEAVDPNLSETKKKNNLSHKLAKVQQMTGMGDDLYIEAILQVHQYDLVMDIFITNRTTQTLQNISVDISTHGDLKLVDSPPFFNLQAGASTSVAASIKVQSTETGIIYGYVTYDTSQSSTKGALVLNEIHIDLLDYVRKCYIGDLAFRAMWAEFEWENKLNINTSITDVSVFLLNIMKHTNMTIVGSFNARHLLKEGDAPPDSFYLYREICSEPISGDSRMLDFSADETALEKQQRNNLQDIIQLAKNSSFFAVNLYSKSIFGEDALTNISLEKLPDQKLAGSIRIRSRTQGIALSLGDRMTIIQRGVSA